MKSETSPTVVRCRLAITSFLSTVIVSSVAHAVAAEYTEMIVFGASLDDAGNLHARFPEALAPPPYFEGRFSNGPVWVEVLAEKLTIPVPQASEKGGTNYAWGGAGTGVLRTEFADDVDEQVAAFLRDRMPSQDQLIVMNGAYNDITRGVPLHDSLYFTSNQLLQLAHEGARNFLVSNLPPKAGSRAPIYNVLLAEELNILRLKNPDLNIKELDVYGVVGSINRDPASFGFTNVNSPACRDCGIGMPSSTPDNIVANPDEYFFWDNIHPSAQAHRVIAGAAHEALSAEPIGPIPTISLLPKSAGQVRDNDFDDRGDRVAKRLERDQVDVGEVDGTSESLSRLVVKFDLPDIARRLNHARLRFFLEETEGTPAGPVSLFHSIDNDDPGTLATEYEDMAYVDTRMHLVQPFDTIGRYYELDVTDLVLSDYASDGDSPFSAFRLQTTEARFANDGQSNLYRFAMSRNILNRPELVLTFGSEASGGDFNANGMLDAGDLDLLADAIRDGQDTLFDWNRDGRLDDSDRSSWLHDLKKTWMGDANLDGEFNSGDLVQVFQAGTFEDHISGNSTWATGDWNGDREFDSADFVLALEDGGFENGTRVPTANVPEPAVTWLIVWIATLGCVGQTERRGASRR